jgi:hypothetical protein
MLSIVFFWLGVVGAVGYTLLAFWKETAPWAQTREGKALIRLRTICWVLAVLLFLALPGALGYFGVIQLTPTIGFLLVLLLSIVTGLLRGQYTRGVEAINTRFNERATPAG